MTNNILKLNYATRDMRYPQEYTMAVFSNIAYRDISTMMDTEKVSKAQEMSYKMSKVTEEVQGYLSQGTHIVTTWEDAGVIISAAGFLSQQDIGFMTILGPSNESGPLYQAVEHIDKVNWVTVDGLKTMDPKEAMVIRETITEEKKVLAKEIRELRAEKKQREEEDKPVVRVNKKIESLITKRNSLGEFYNDGRMTNMALKIIASRLTSTLMLITSEHKLTDEMKIVAVDSLNNKAITVFINSNLNTGETVRTDGIENLPVVSRALIKTSETPFVKDVNSEVEIDLSSFNSIFNPATEFSETVKLDLDIKLNDNVKLNTEVIKGDVFHPTEILYSKTHFNLTGLGPDENIILIDMERSLTQDEEDKFNQKEGDNQDGFIKGFGAIGVEGLEDNIEDRISISFKRGYIVALYLEKEQSKEIMVDILMSELAKSKNNRAIIFMSPRYEFTSKEIFQKIIKHPQIMTVNPEMFAPLALGTSLNKEGEEIGNFIKKGNMERFVISTICDFVTMITDSSKKDNILLNMFAMNGKSGIIMTREKDSNFYIPKKHINDKEKLELQAKSKKHGYYAIADTYNKAREVISEDKILSKVNIGEKTERLV